MTSKGVGMIRARFAARMLLALGFLMLAINEKVPTAIANEGLRNAMMLT